MKIDILTLFPEMFAPLEHSIVGKAREKGLLDISYHNFREYAEKSRHVDDEPYGGGQGMLLRAQPIFDCIEAIGAKQPRIILLDPAGKRFDQALAEEFAQEEELIFICGHYEGYDERIKTLVTDEVSLGDFVLTGGELAAMTMVDATVRLIPEVIGKESSHQDDSFSSGLLEYPQYTRPYDFRGMVVPDVLMSGHHEKIRLWRLEQSLKKTLERRPDLLETYQLSAEEETILGRIKADKALEQTIWQAFDLMDQGQSQEALNLLDSLEVVESSSLYYDYLSTYGYVYADLKRYEEALASYQTYLERAITQGDTSHQHMAHHQLAMVYRLMGDYPSALTSLEAERQLIEQCAATDNLVWSVHLYEVAYLSFLSGDNSRAAELMQSSLDYAQKTDDLIALACAHRGLGEILGQVSHFERAKELFGQAGDDKGVEEVAELLANTVNP